MKKVLNTRRRNSKQLSEVKGAEEEKDGAS